MKSKIIVNGTLSEKIDITRSVRQGCPIAPLLYICVIETILIKIRENKLICGIKSPTSSIENKLSAFADDTNFLLRDTCSADRVIQTFNKFGKASGSKVNLLKTEGMWLGSNKDRSDTPLNIKWVRNSKSLGIYHGHENTKSLNWFKCINNFRIHLMLHINRNTTIIGKTSILNAIGYSKLWYKASTLLLPSGDCRDKNGKILNIENEIDRFTAGFLWGFKKK